MVDVTLKDCLHIQINTSDVEYLKAVKEEFTRHVEGYFWMKKYRSGFWDGTMSLFDSATRTLPYGLFFDFLRFHKRMFAGYKLNIDKSVKELFLLDKTLDIQYDLNLKPYPYQQDCIETALRFQKCIIRAATSSGKSLMISYILKILTENGLARRQLIIVPSTGLIEQFYSDMLEYGIDKSLLGKVYAKQKEFGSPIVIGTWQTLTNNQNKLSLYDTIVVDETHSVKAKVIYDVVRKCENARFRFGFTGTMPPNELDCFQVKAYLGSVVKEYSSGVLADLGYVSKCNVNMITIKYKDDYDGQDYNTAKDVIFTNEYRLSLIKNILSMSDENYLLLVGKVKKEGYFLKEALESSFRDREVVFLSGKDENEVRELWRKKMHKEKSIILIATYQIFQQGVNIPSLKYVIFASPYKSKIRVIQSAGRALRKFGNKINGAELYDLIDDVKWFSIHGEKRLRFFEKEDFNIRKYTLKEGDDMSVLRKMCK